MAISQLQHDIHLNLTDATHKHSIKAICPILKYLCLNQFHGVRFSTYDIRKFHIWVGFRFQSLNLYVYKLDREALFYVWPNSLNILHTVANHTTSF